MFIIKIQTERPQARADRDRFYLLQLRYRLVALLQTVVGNAGAHMMNVMKTDVARYPLQQLRQLVIRSPFHSNPPGIPLIMARPVYPLELMLNVEQPESQRRSQNQNRKLGQKISLEA